MNVSTDTAAAATREVKAKRAVRAAFLGFFVDMYDVYLPIAVLAPALAYFVPKNLAASTRATILFLVFAVTLIGRPVGAVIFGHFGDTVGRRRTTLISVAGFCIATLLIAVLPGYVTWGVGSIVLLIALRFIAGCFIGGEYTAANPLAMEYAAKHKRGTYGARIHLGYPGALLVITGFTAVLVASMASGGQGSSYSVWGWRIPFFVGVAISAALFLYYYHKVPESELWQASKKAGSPLGELIRGPNLRRLAQLFIVMTGAWLTLDATVGALPGVVKVLGVKDDSVNTGTLIAAAIAILLYPALGKLSQGWGRRPTIALIGLLNMIPAAAAYVWLVSSGYRSGPLLVILVAIASLFGLLLWAVHTPYLVESFRTSVRAAGYGISYSLATIIPGFYSFYLLGLGKLIPYEYTPVVLLVLGGILLAVGAILGPETKDIDFAPSASSPAHQKQ